MVPLALIAQTLDADVAMLRRHAIVIDRNDAHHGTGTFVDSWGRQGRRG
jgi:hypothetical protein